MYTPYERVIILALDSVCWELMAPLADDGTMPTFGRLMRQASYGVLESTIPPHTAAAWTTFLTGKDPGKHGVVDFVKFDPTRHVFKFHDSSGHRDTNFLTMLSNAGISCGSIFLPRNYPPYKLKDGYIISGFETPRPECEFADPPDLRSDVMRVAPTLHFNFEDDWEDDADDRAFKRNIERAMMAVEWLERLAIHIQRERPVTVQIAYLQATDILFHKAWRWCDPKTAHENPYRAGEVRQFFRRVDQLVNRVLGMHSSDSQRGRGNAGTKTLRLVCSDHGHGISNGRIFINNLLRDWGFLTQLGGLGRVTRKLSLLTMNSEQRRVKKKEMDLDWSRTKAYMAHVGIFGYVYVNLKGREPRGIVPADQYEPVREQLIEKFKAARIPGTDLPLFQAVHKGEEVYTRKQELNLPDIIVAPADGWYPRKKLGASRTIFPTPNAVGGVHRQDGIYLFSGDGIKFGRGKGLKHNIQDIAPTLLAALGQPIPSDMTGKPMLDIFEEPMTPTYTDMAGNVPGSGSGQSVYSEDEAREIEKRLSDLGYLE